MKIHFHTDCYWFSGSETTLTALIQHLGPDWGFETSFTYVPWPDYVPGLRGALGPTVDARPLKVVDPAGMKAALIGNRGRNIEVSVKAVCRALPLRQISLASSVRRLTRIFESEAPDVVHINNGGFPGAISCNAAAIAARRADVPAVVYVVNNLAYRYRRPSRIADFPIDRAVARSVSTFVTGSEAAGDALGRVLRLPPGKRAVIPNTVVRGSPGHSAAATRRRLRLEEGVPVVAIVARLEGRKGHRYLFEACHRLVRATGLAVTVLVAGTGPLADDLVALVRSLGIQTQVRFLGHEANVWDLLQVADVLALPSTAHEDFPVVILEAMAAGVPVVASRFAGIPEQVADGLTGLLVPPGDVPALAAALGRLLTDDRAAGAMGAAAKARFDAHFTPEIAVSRYVAMYRSLLADRSRSLEDREPA